MADISSAFVQRGLTLRHMRLLIALEDMRQVGRVASALSISQPAVSKALLEIENGVGVALFDRTPRGMVPTAHGACLLRHAHTMTNELSRAVDELTGIEQGIAEAVAVGATAGAGTGSLLGAAIRQGRARLPALTVTVSEGTREHLLRQLRTGRLDLVVGATTDGVIPIDLECTPLYIDAPAIVCGNGHALAARRRPAWTTLAAEAWVLPPRTTRVRAAVEALFRRAGGPPPRVLAETLSLDLILELLGQGDALGVLPQHLARRLAMAGQLRTLEVDTPGLVMPVAVFTQAAGAPSTAIDTLRRCLLEAAASR
ncbi:LysR substrate-binding domain-containing protein [Variovorax sp. J22P168]|uniref:LysR substrate-binding domain-containing protein n=1 Tax=Variovorax jilinensis TaxID=3053513 RepID=UPI002576CDD5|nr:LysR substrate-binding domain-containing protein [Variovorax sp. J22P168]MDM0015798.1 LysR substrate-binding domain-containing protein [Variovorax sp. J22P168]